MHYLCILVKRRVGVTPRLTAQREVTGLAPGMGSIIRVPSRLPLLAKAGLRHPPQHRSDDRTGNSVMDRFQQRIDDHHREIP